MNQRARAGLRRWRAVPSPVLPRSSHREPHRVPEDPGGGTEAGPGPGTSSGGAGRRTTLEHPRPDRKPVCRREDLLASGLRIAEAAGDPRTASEYYGEVFSESNLTLSRYRLPDGCGVRTENSIRPLDSWSQDGSRTRMGLRPEAFVVRNLWLLQSEWCRRSDSNRHGLKVRGILSSVGEGDRRLQE